MRYSTYRNSTTTHTKGWVRTWTSAAARECRTIVSLCVLKLDRFLLILISWNNSDSASESRRHILSSLRNPVSYVIGHSFQDDRIARSLGPW
jgi:hypothetical protein